MKQIRIMIFVLTKNITKLYHYNQIISNIITEKYYYKYVNYFRKNPHFSSLCMLYTVYNLNDLIVS